MKPYSPRSLSTIGAFLAGAAFAYSSGLPGPIHANRGVEAASQQDSAKESGEKQGEKQDEKKASEARNAAMRDASKVTAVGPKHALLSRFLGDWDYTLSITNFAETKGTASFAWLIDGRWLHAKSSGSMFGDAMESHAILGYDNFKKSYVTTFVNSMDTAMLHSEGDLDRSGKTLTTYGKMDEYLTGEHDKMVRYVWRFVSDDEIRFEVHDLGIGEPNTKVLDYTYTRRKGAAAAKGSEKSKAPSAQGNEGKTKKKPAPTQKKSKN